MAAPSPTSTRSPLDQPVTTLWGVGSERAKQLARLDIHTIDDLLLHRPRRYEDRRKFRSIAELHLDEPTLTRGKIVAMGVKRYRKGTKSVFEFVLEDVTARLHCRWWNLPFMENYFEVGDEVVVFGRPLSLKPRTMDHPETEVIEGGEESFIHFSRIVPVYPLTEGLPQRWLRGLIFRTLEKYVGTKRVERTKPNDPLNDIIPRNDAIRLLHFPKEMPDVDTARRRLALSEFMSLQVDIQTRRKNFEANAHGLPCPGDNHLIKPFLAKLGFKLTAAQTRVLREIRKDMGGAHPMRRLLQGDVGSGKTAVAACTALMALESSFSVALMAPTEILAEQHYHNFQKWFEPLGVNVELETANRKTSTLRNQTTFQSPTRSHASLFIGTHALIEAGLNIPNLGLVMIDEQHKFGVAQRELLVRKGRYPHLLVTTATPIPRTLGLTLYGDLDVSVIDELPPGRGSIKTFVRTTDKLPKVREFMREKLASGRQAYVVYPRVEDDTGGVKAVMKEFENLKSALSPSRVGLLHGRLPGAEAERVMTAFRAGDIKVLLATSLIEVGVDVPNATVMLIENAETFGLAQLHQLRGRIGRGAHKSYCILISDAKTVEARERLRVLEETNDGFRISEADLKLRGPGELLGRQQSGETRFRFGDLINDYDLVLQARELAGRMTGVVGRTAGL